MYKSYENLLNCFANEIAHCVKVNACEAVKPKYQISQDAASLLSNNTRGFPLRTFAFYFVSYGINLQRI